MLDRVEAAAKGQSLRLTDTAIETVVSKLRAALRAQFEAEYKEFIDAAEAVQAAGAVSDVEIARAQADEAAQEALAKKLHAIDHGAVGSDPPTHRRVDVTEEELEELRAELDSGRAGTSKRGVPTLDAWRLADATIVEKKAVVKALHSDPSVVSAVATLTGSPLIERVKECLPSASGAAGLTKSFADIASATTDEIVANLSALSLPQLGERDWAAWGQQQSPPRVINAGLNNETELLKALAELEKKKAAGGKKHPPFTHVALLEPQSLSEQQLGKVLAFLKEPRTGLNANDARRAVTRCLPDNPALKFRLALAEATKLCDAESARWVQQYARLCRAVNVSWGRASEDWKTWWVVSGLLNLSKHACDDCDDCERFLHFSGCGCDDEPYRPPGHASRTARERHWPEFDRPDDPPLVSTLAATLVDGFTVGAVVRKYVRDSVLFGRTAGNESLNNIYGHWTPKHVHQTVRAPAHASPCLVLWLARRSLVAVCRSSRRSGRETPAQTWPSTRARAASRRRRCCAQASGTRVASSSRGASGSR